jgi:hypothetical protein
MSASGWSLPRFGGGRAGELKLIGALMAAAA